MPSVLLLVGTSAVSTIAATITWQTTATTHTNGPHPMSDHRNRSPMSSASRPVPQRRDTYRHHANDGPYPTAARIATYTITGQPNDTS